MQKRVLVFLLLAFLVAGVAGAARLPSPRQGIVHERRAPADLQVLPTLWEALASMLSRLKAHGTMDPDGTPSASTPEGETGDAHGTMDPNG